MSLILAVQLLLGFAAQVADPAWYSSYEHGLESLQAGDFGTAYGSFQAALSARVEEALHVPTQGVHSVDYLPHLYLAVTAYHLGRIQEAAGHLATAERSGVALKSAVGGPLFEHYQGLIWAALRAQTGAAPEGGPSPEHIEALRSDERAPVKLSPVEVRAVTRETLVRCGLAADGDAGSAPWYFHYELGLELAELGDSQRALDALLAAVDRKPLPKEYARMYGMWFTHYRPYLAIAESHLDLGNWRCAFNALELAQETGEAATDDEEVMARYRRLLDECEAHLFAASAASSERRE